MSAELWGKTAIVTGASRGIGAAAARALSNAGANVLLAARSADEIGRQAADILAAGKQAYAVTCDVSRYDDMSEVVRLAEKMFGPVDILVNNAGVIEPIAHLAESDPEAWSHVVDINLKGVYFGSRAVLPSMIERGTGTIITIGSGAAHGAMEGWSHYCTTKAGALMLTKAIHKEAHEKGVTSINLSPGTVATQMQVDIKASGINPVSQLDPSVHIPADWPARAIVWLSGEQGAEFAGEEVSLRDETIRARIGLVS